ncbi:anhydro-N-acetylmuramic acid kinase [Maribacter cobaltidurans]|uniref:Anhydro-N-acetylmuramic acid kinase n=1 Tax=Maribacter cobaltidurans TaxID=1178778 RepID=A0A223V0D5_9FLAO|nr:anhydro-N-acetylmuramic acid kinase [Maribacter cobaltidurans]ASV28885.1 anhydro-N-acetylmuramic acid kinase [Maribacter cobaltidurans]GGD74026.1 anhydro-N-acetylmuramic acid kinase [Maribacter cobaltidurans]
MKIYKVVGMMSGTSLDGLDLAYCHFWKKKDQWQFEIKASESISYAPKMQSDLKDAIHLSAEKLLQLHNEYGNWLGERAKDFIQEQNLEVNFIASHGHTSHHRPELGLTFQLGSGQHLANASEHTIICDFRSNDLALGGQGAPLVPIGDRLLFSEYDFCLNLGGISNISFELKGRRIAYDIGLANMILNYITRKIDLDYDENGTLARSGTINPMMLKKLNGLSYYLLPHPKSIGYEWFLEKVVPIVNETKDSTENLLHTAIHHICEKIAQQVALNTNKTNQKLFVTGGGALNAFLIETLEQKLDSKIEVVVPDKILIEFKEALVFAFMGVLRSEKEINVLKTVTGAKRDSSSGVIFLPN